MAIYTSSPLGLLGNVGKYDLSKTKFDSLFSSTTKFSTLPGSGSSMKNFSVLGSVKSLHNDEIYDIRTENIIKKLNGADHLRLKYADFAYLKDYGVYPNNRLIIARRFPTPVRDDLYSISSEKGPGLPMSTIIGYKGNTDDFLSFEVSENWTDAEASFKDVLNEIGDDMPKMVTGGIKLGDILDQGLHVIPLPGVTLLMQRTLMEKLGIINKDDASDIPIGDPNLIKAGKIRTTLKDETAGSGLSGKFTITFTTVYEQKIIQGVDSTLVYMDILSNLLSMGTSNAKFYLGRSSDSDSGFEKFVNTMMTDPQQAIVKLITATVDAFKEMIGKVVEGLKKAGSSLVDAAKHPEQAFESIKAGLQEAVNYLTEFISTKYRVRVMGILAALTGGPSTPWHVTIGNPLRPIFCSGDMLCTGVKLTLGPQLEFNDLPYQITAEVTLTSARDLGLQEIFAKFNAGGIRTSDGTYNIKPADTFWSKSPVTLTGKKDAGTTASVSLGASASYLYKTTGQSLSTQQISSFNPRGYTETSKVASQGPNVGTPVVTNPDASSAQPTYPATNLKQITYTPQPSQLNLANTSTQVSPIQYTYKVYYSGDGKSIYAERYIGSNIDLNKQYDASKFDLDSARTDFVNMNQTAPTPGQSLDLNTSSLNQSKSFWK